MEPTVPTRPPFRHGTARVIAAVVAWLLVGASVGVAFSWVLLGLTHGDDDLYPDNLVLPENAAWPIRVAEGWPTRPTSVSGITSPFFDDLQYGEPRGQNWLGVIRAGWPARSLMGMTTTRQSPFTEQRSYLLAQFPLLPIWPGFALNTLFYAAIAWGLWRIPILIRRHRRRIRGLCLRCAYNRAGLAPNSPCPECGHAPTPALSASSA